MDAAPCNAAQGDVAQNAPERDAKTLRQKATVPGENALAPRQSLRHTIKHKRKRGPESPLFLRPHKAGRRPNADAAMPHPRRLRPQERNGALVRRGRYPSRLSAPHEAMIGAFPFPGRRAQAGEAETRLSAGRAPHAPRHFPPQSLPEKRRILIFAPGDRLSRAQQFSGRSAAGEPGGQKRRQAAASGRGQRRKSIPRRQRHGQRHAGFRLNPRTRRRSHQAAEPRPSALPARSTPDTMSQTLTARKPCDAPSARRSARPARAWPRRKIRTSAAASAAA